MQLLLFYSLLVQSQRVCNIMKIQKKVKELEAKIQECDKNANSAKTDTEYANAYKAQKSLWKKLGNNLRNKINNE